MNIMDYVIGQREMSGENSKAKRGPRRARPEFGAVLDVLAFLLVVAFVISPSASHAAFPGLNGKIAFMSDRDGDPEIYTMNPDGTGLTQLTNNTA